MAICTKCNAENRPEAAFCVRCGAILFAQPASTKPARIEPALSESQPSIPAPSEPVPLTRSEPVPSEPSSPIAAPSRPEESPMHLPGFTSRPEGSIFADRFQYQALIYHNEYEFQYNVTELCQPLAPCIRICSNPDCRTIHPPIDAEQEKYCTHCGSPLEQEAPDLFLKEADADRYGILQPVIDLHLTHPAIHPPITTFQEELPDGIRYCLITPSSHELPAQPELSRVLEWGIQLAEGLDYLHAHGVAFGEELDPGSFGLVSEKIVWRYFDNVRILPMLADREKINNVRLLALSMYAWLTGKESYSPDPSLSPEINELFYRALIGEGFTSGAAFASQIDLILKVGSTPVNIDYLVGRRTHPGLIRDGNEDGLLCLTLSRTMRNISQPIGLFVVADGMGGHATGDLASSLTIQTIVQKSCPQIAQLQNLSSEEYTVWIKGTIQEANQAVYEARQKEGTDMGSTLVCALIQGSQAFLAHVGDSRIYLIREGSIQQLTNDHSLVQQLVAMGQIKPDEARTHPQRNVILRSLGERPEVEVDIFLQDLLPGDRLLLCSDGLSGMLDDQKMQIIIQESQSPQVACDYLVDAANLAGGEDNISVILVEILSA